MIKCPHQVLALMTSIYYWNVIKQPLTYLLSTSETDHRAPVGAHTRERSNHRKSGSTFKHGSRRLKNQTRERNFRCMQCSASFARLGDLKRHIRIHTGEKNYRCEQCSAAFSDSGALKKHIRTHAVEKTYNFVCQECGSAFSQRDHLVKHMVIHVGEKRCQCQVCGVAFLRNSHLNAHLRIHTGEKNFKCSKCDKLFARNNSLKRHFMKKHKLQQSHLEPPQLSVWTTVCSCFLFYI